MDKLLPMSHSLRGLYSINQGLTFADYMITDLERFSGPIGSNVTADEDRFYVVWTNERTGTGYRCWNVFFDRSNSDSMTWEDDRAITSNYTLNTFFSNNAIAANNSGLMKVLSTKREDKRIDGEFVAGKWNTILRSSLDYGNTFYMGAVFYDSKHYEAWNPKVFFLNPDTVNFVIIWEQHSGSNGGEIYGRKQISTKWGNIFPVSSLDDKDSAEPDLATYNGNIYVGWQDYETGNWQIKVQKLN